ncbi:MAG TPA: GNAT family N-acetyltransferase, partial [Armatimonadetes bacterium]|nr:GNAT family N-acetyltransferase [Armatimonadota bacterium]
WLYRGDPHGFFVAEVNGNIVGFVSVHTGWWDRRIGQTAEIHEVVVDRMYQRRGIGSLLMDRALQYARERGCNQASLWVGTANTVAREWYKRMGFKETGRGYDWVRMVKELKHLP